ncbi:MAG: Na(+)/H(+) antiporter subunit B [Desulfobacteraceae bacterium]|nr:MAG: Na(+)/H(+) antiporter subunit B [Desulfobacteraceae bacterium]
MKRGGLVLFSIMGLLLAWGVLEFPGLGDPSSPASSHLSPYYIQHSLTDTAVPNMVTAVLADYRGYDTMFETIVIFTAAIVCIFLLRTFKPPASRYRMYRHMATGITLRIEKGGKTPDDSEHFERIDSVWVPHDLVIRTTCRMVIPFIQVFALYVIAHGHHSPGGGFQGGVILGASVVLFAVCFDLRRTIRYLGEKMCALLCALGVLIYAGTGILCMGLQSNFLDYSALAGLFGTDPVMARSHGILIVEIGVGMAVMAVMVMLYYNLASAGRHDEGL